MARQYSTTGARRLAEAAHHLVERLASRRSDGVNGLVEAHPRHRNMLFSFYRYPALLAAGRWSYSTDEVERAYRELRGVAELEGAK